MAVRSRTGILYLDFYCYLPDGRRVRCRESTGLQDNERNRKIARAKDKAIRYELKYGRFRYLHFFPHGARARHFRKTASTLTLGEWWREWIEAKTIRPSTYNGWKSTWRCHTGPRFEYIPLAEIDEHSLLIYRKEILAKGLAESYINERIMKPLCMCLLSAYKRGLIERYPCQEIKSLSGRRTELDPLSFEELSHLLAVLEDKRPMYHNLLFIWSRTGLRPGEICALRWEHVDWFNRKLLVRATRWAGEDGPPKTTHSVRDVDLRPPVLAILKRQQALTGLQGGYVFLTEAGTCFSDNTLRHKFHFLFRLAGLKPRPPKQIRHTFATLHIAATQALR
jgi:integrase